MEDLLKALLLLVSGLNVMNCKPLFRYVDLAQTTSRLRAEIESGMEAWYSTEPVWRTRG
jgi:hypothetical protein